MILVGSVLLLLTACVGLAATAEAYQQHQRDARFRAWMVQSQAAAEAHLPLLLKDFAGVSFAGDLHRSDRPARDLPDNRGAELGPWHAVRSPQASATEVADALRRGGFTGVASLEELDGWKVTGATSDGKVMIYLHPNGDGSSVLAFLMPAMPACC